MLGRLVNFAVQIVRTIIFYAHSTLHFIKVSILFRTRKKLFEATSESTQERVSPAKAMVIAGFPKEDCLYRESLKNQLTACESLGIHPIYVSNITIPQDLEELLVNFNATVLRRQNRGRDFGAYQAALAWLNQNELMNSIETLFLTNDTLYYLTPPDDVYARLSKEEWGCLYMNLERHSHAQSFLLSFSKTVFSSNAFVRFWNQYVPSNIRRHAIHKGEIALSSALIKQGFRVKPYVNDFDFATQANLDSLTSKKKFSQLNLPVGNLVGALEFPFSPVVASSRKSKAFAKATPNFLTKPSQLLEYVYSDAPHRIGIHLSVLIGIPLKKDIYKYFSTSEIKHALDIVESPLSEAIVREQVERLQVFMSGDIKSQYLRHVGEV